MPSLSNSYSIGLYIDVLGSDSIMERYIGLPCTGKNGLVLSSNRTQSFRYVLLSSDLSTAFRSTEFLAYRSATALNVRLCYLTGCLTIGGSYRLAGIVRLIIFWSLADTLVVFVSRLVLFVRSLRYVINFYFSYYFLFPSYGSKDTLEK